ERIRMSDYAGDELHQHEQRIDQQAGLRPANAPARRAIHSDGLPLKVGLLQSFGGGVDAGRVWLGIFSGYSIRNHKIRTLRLGRRWSVDEEISSPGDDVRVEAIDRG